jgi:circadian clock protein KaiB
VAPTRRLRGVSEAAMSKGRRVLFKFRLYVADHTPNSVLALTNLTAICRTYLPDRYEIEVVDVFQKPKRAVADEIFMTPALVRLAPLPMVHIVGTLSQTQDTLKALGLEALIA